MTDSGTFQLNGQAVELAGNEPTLSLLRWLNRTGCHGTKEGCADGDCGACTVALVDVSADGKRSYRAINSCLLPLGFLPGREVVSVEHLADGETLHPVQQAMVDCHASQCGYCTPGFVMSLFAGCHEGELDDHTIEGNLCRCTGYLPIRRAMQRLRETGMGNDRLALAPQGAPLASAEMASRFFSPLSIDDALRLKQTHADATWIAGATDLGVEMSRGRHQEQTFIALDRIAELQQLAIDAEGVSIGAAVPLRRLEVELAESVPALVGMLQVFAARQVKNRATLGGNLGTASPIGDLLPVLLALDGEIRLTGPTGSRVVAAHEYFVDYRKTARQDDELVVAVRLPQRTQHSAAYKVSKRPSDDISIVAAAFTLVLDSKGYVQHVRLAYGGVAAVPLRALAVENFLLGRRLDAQTLTEAQQQLTQAFNPLSDHRGSADYRRDLCASLFARFVAEHLP